VTERELDQFQIEKQISPRMTLIELIFNWSKLAIEKESRFQACGSE
jgi:hypothetical protein